MSRKVIPDLIVSLDGYVADEAGVRAIFVVKFNAIRRVFPGKKI